MAQKKIVGVAATAKAASAAGPRKSISVPSGGRTKESDGIQWKVTGDGVRDNCLGMIYDGLCAESIAGECSLRALFLRPLLPFG